MWLDWGIGMETLPTLRKITQDFIIPKPSKKPIITTYGVGTS